MFWRRIVDGDKWTNPSGEWQSAMSGLKTTFEVLGKTKNEAALGVLLSALDTPDLQVQSGGLETLLKRPGTAGPRELLKRWHVLSERWKKVAAQNVNRISRAIRDAILSDDEHILRNACEVTLCIRDYDLVRTLATVALDHANPHGELAAETIVTLCEKLCEELASTRDNTSRRHLQTARQHVVGALEPAANNFEVHKNKTLLEAFLMLANCQNAILKRVLQHPHDPAHADVLHILANSPRPGVMRLLFNYLDQSNMPSSIYSVLARRSDLTFVRHLVKRFATGIRSEQKKHLQQLESFVWLQPGQKVFSALGEQEQSGAIELAMNSGMSRADVFEVIREACDSAHATTRLAAAQQLAEFRGEDANSLIEASIDDNDPMVQAHLASILREHHVDNAISTLVALLDSPHEVVKKAACENLADFSFAPFLSAFDQLDDDDRRLRGSIVTRVDTDAIAGVKAELTSDSRSRCLRGIQATIAMRAAQQVEDELVALVSDDDHLIRTNAVQALSGCESAAARTALRDALLDDSRTVREIAERVLQAFSERSTEADHALPLQLDPGHYPSTTQGVVE